MADSKSPLLRYYYHHRFFMGYCAIGAEVTSLLLYMLGAMESDGTTTLNLWQVIKASIENTKSPYGLLLASALPGWAINQIVNMVQIKTAADVCVQFDMERHAPKAD